jgi:hypothetical protein
MQETSKTRRAGAALLCALLMTVPSALTIAAAAGADSGAGQPEANHVPLNVGGSHSWITAPEIQYNSAGGFYGVFNSSTSSIEEITGWLDGSQLWPTRSHYYKVQLPKGKVLDVSLQTAPCQAVPFGNGNRVSPDMEIFLYAGIPDSSTLIDWNVVSNSCWQEVNILTPISPSATYYINVTSFWGQGTYNLNVTVSDPTDITGGGDFTGQMDLESAADPLDTVRGFPDTAWYRFTATHDTASTTFQEAHGWLELTNWNPTDETEVDALIRIFAEDLGYSPDNPVGRPMEKSEAPNRQVEPFSVLAPYTGTYYLMLRLTNVTSAQYTLHFELSPVVRFPSGGIFGATKDRTYDDTDWYWFNMTAASGTGRNDRVIFNLSETSDDPQAPVNLNLWVFSARPYFKPAGGSNEFDILNSSFQGDAPYNLSLNPEPRYEEVAAQATYTGIYFVEVEDYNNTGTYDLIMRYDTGTFADSDNNNVPSQAQPITWGEYPGNVFDQSEDHSDFYKITATAGQTIDIYWRMPNRNLPDGQQNRTAGLVWIGIYQAAGMQLLNWSWNYWYDFDNTTDWLYNETRVQATVAADGDYIVEVTALQDGYIGPFTLPGTQPPRTIQVLWHMDWNFRTTYLLMVSLLPGFNAFPEPPVTLQSIPDTVIQEDQTLAPALDLGDYFRDPDIIQGDHLTYTFQISGQRNVTLNETGGLVSITPDPNWYGTNRVLVVARDSQNNVASLLWNITATPVNDPPELLSAGPVVVSQDSGVLTLLTAGFVRDVDGDLLTFTPEADANVTLTFTDTTFRIATVPYFQTTSLGAPYPVCFDVTDGQEDVHMCLLLQVNNVLDAPKAILKIVNISCDEDAACATIHLPSVFWDPDGAALGYSIFGNGEVGFDFPDNDTLALLPPQDWSGAKTIQIQAHKWAGTPQTLWNSEIVEINLLVREVNDAPSLSNPNPIGDWTMEEGTSRAFTIQADDPEHSTPKYRWFLDGESLGNTLASYTFTPGYGTAPLGGSALLTLTVEVDDGVGGVDSYEWQVTVVDVPRAPQVEIAAPLEGTRGYYVDDQVKFFASASDPDGDTLTFTWTDSGGQTVLTGASGNVTFGSQGVRKITLTVSDGLLTTTRTVNVTVEEKPAPTPGFEGPALVGAMLVAVGVAAIEARRRRLK